MAVLLFSAFVQSSLCVSSEERCRYSFYCVGLLAFPFDFISQHSFTFLDNLFTVIYIYIFDRGV